MNDRVDSGPDEQVPEKRKKKFSILVDGYVRDLFATGMILQKLDYDAYIVSSAEDALKLMDSALPALVITELSLPRMSGLELLVRIKQEPMTRAVPVIIHTSSVDEQREALCSASGCASFLRKPVDPETLYSAIQHATEITPRQHLRLRTLLPVMVGGRPASDSGLSTEYVSELSENGIFVRTLSPRPIDAVLPVTIMIHSIPVRVKAVVLRSVLMGQGLFREPGMGMKFTEIAKTDRELIRNFVKGQLIQDIPAH